MRQTHRAPFAGEYSKTTGNARTRMYYGVDQNDIMRTEASPLATRYPLRAAHILMRFPPAVGEGRTEISIRRFRR